MSPEERDRTFFRQEFDLTDGSYAPDTTAEELKEKIFTKDNKTTRNKVTMFGVITIIMNGDTGKPYEYDFRPVLDKTEPSEINRNRDGLNVGCDVLIMDSIPESERPEHGDVVKLTGIWRYIPEQTYFRFYVLSVEFVGKSTW